MPALPDLVLGALKVTNLPAEFCFKSAQDLIEALPSLLTVEVPSSITNVVISAQQPGDDQRNSLWIRMDTNGDFIGLYIYALGNWQQIYPVPSTYTWVYNGDSREPPKGFDVVWNLSGIPTYQKDFLKSQSLFHDNDPDEGYWVIFPVVYVGF